MLNAGSSGPAEVLLDSIDLSISGRKVADLGASGAMTAGSGGASVSRGRPTTILTPPEKDSQGAIIPFVPNSPSRGLFYVEVKARIQAGVLAVDVVDRNNKGHNAEGLLEQVDGDQDIFVRVPPGLQEGDIEFRNAASGTIRSRAAISDVILWKVN